MSAFGGIVTLVLAGGLPAAERFYDRLRLVARAASLGGVESLASLPVHTSHHGLPEDKLREAGIDPGHGAAVARRRGRGRPDRRPGAGARWLTAAAAAALLQQLIGLGLLGLGLYFAVQLARGLAGYLRYRRVAPTALVTWPAPRAGAASLAGAARRDRRGHRGLQRVDAPARSTTWSASR